MKLKDNLTAEEHKKAEEERQRPFRMDIADVGNDCVSIKAPVVISKDKYELLKKICDITGEHLQTYVKDAFFTKVQIDLDNPTCFGQLACENLKRQWDPEK